MFSVNELVLIRECLKELQENLRGHLQSPVFSSTEKLHKLQELESMGEIINRIDAAENMYVSLDADHLGEMYVFMDTFKEHVTELCRAGKMGAEDYANTLYRIGFLRGKIEFGLLTEKEYAEVMDAQDTME